MREVTLAVTQFACGPDLAANAERAESMVRQAANQGGQVILLQELFEGPYFCKTQDPAWFDIAGSVSDSPLIGRFSKLARELGVVLPLSFFERAGAAFFNSLAMIDADGTLLGIYRKSHIPQNPGYEEKYYFSPGDSGFRVWRTAFGRVGAGICWDQWFPEAARAMALAGAEMLVFPTAIGSEPSDPDYDSRDHWQTVMRGHAAANLMPLAAANRVGHEEQDGTAMTFYGSSFIAGPSGEMAAEANRSDETVLTATFDLDAVIRLRRGWGVFRDRRPDLYGLLGGFDGRRG